MTPSGSPFSWPATSAGGSVSRSSGPTPTDPAPARTAPGGRKEDAGRDEQVLALIRLFYLLHWRPEAIAPLLRILPDATARALRRSDVSEGSIRALTEFAEGPKAVRFDNSPVEMSCRLLDLRQPARTSRIPAEEAEWTSDT